MFPIVCAGSFIWATRDMTSPWRNMLQYYSMNTSNLAAKLVMPTDGDSIIRCEGNWSIADITSIDSQFSQTTWPESSNLTIDGSNIKLMDSVGAWVLQKCLHALYIQGKKVQLTGFSQSYETLLNVIKVEFDQVNKPITRPKQPSWLAQIGIEIFRKIKQLDGFLVLIGELSTYIVRGIKKPSSLQLPSITSIVEKAGVHALPIIALLMFLIGIVLTYQAGLQLRAYGAESYVITVSGIAILREFAPLITAIIIAGRTSSSFTAQIGLMKVNSEIDALRTMGVSPIERIVLPRVLGLLIALPILIFWADVFGVIGSMFMAKNMFDTGFIQFIIQFKQVASIQNYLIGLVKAPFFAIIIAIVGCYQGFQVSSSADSVGYQTTKSVVQAIFLIIIADGIFSLLFSWMGV